MPNQGQSEQQWQQSVHRAQSCLKQQDYPGAIEAARESLQLKPDQALSLSLLASGLNEQGDYFAALQCIDQAHLLEPDNDTYLRIKAEICLKQGDLDIAQQLIEESLDHSPNDLAAREFLGDVLRGKEQFEDAMSIYLDLPESAALKPKMFTCMMHLKVFECHPRVEKLALDYLSDRQNEPNHLAKLICDLLSLKYLSKDDIDLNILASDPLLSLSLSKMILCLHSFEPLLLNLRAGMLQTCLGQLCIPDNLETLCCALARQCYSNEYCWFINEDEQTLLDGLEVLYCQTMEAGINKPDEISAIVILLAMYKPVTQLPHCEQLAAMPLMAWPKPMQEFIQIGLLDILEEREIALEIPSVSEIHDAVSLQVQARYEEHTYPRWLTVDHADRSTPYVSLYDYLDIQAEDFFPGETLQILIAGCGTGQQSNHLAEQTEDTQITAIDLSRASLAYGKRMAQRHSLNNVEYIQGDILELGSFGKQFHVIECSGVLHHLQDPMAGLTVLAGLLKPGGLLKLGLYSTLAREPINRLRNLSERIDVQPTAENIRSLRHHLLFGDIEPEFERILDWPGSHSMSGCRNLLFPVQERQFTLLQIKEMLSQHSLIFKGLQIVDEDALTRYRAMFPWAIDLVNLDNWHELEQEYPTTFANMYQFHCQLGS